MSTPLILLVSTSLTLRHAGSVQSFTPNAVPKLPVLSFTYKRKEPFKDTCEAGTLLTDINIVFIENFFTKSKGPEKWMVHNINKINQNILICTKFSSR
jgi:hypothetical protein